MNWAAFGYFALGFGFVLGVAIAWDLYEYRRVRDRNRRRLGIELERRK